MCPDTEHTRRTEAVVGRQSADLTSNDQAQAPGNARSGNRGGRDNEPQANRGGRNGRPDARDNAPAAKDGDGAANSKPKNPGPAPKKKGTP